MNLIPRSKSVILTIVLVALVPAALAGPPRFTSINFPAQPGQTVTGTFALGTNPAGDIVGAYDDQNGEHGFLLRGGTFTSFDYPDARVTWTDAYAINPEGDIVGQYGLPDNTTHGFLLRHDVFYPVDIAGPTDAGLANSMPYAISPDGTIVGCYHQSNAKGGAIAGTMHGFVLTAEGVTFDPVPGSMHQGINPSGDITGYVGSDGRSYVISSDGVRTWLNYPGAGATRATDVSASGNVVGWQNTAGHLHGFLLREGEFTSFDVEVPGLLATRPYKTNPQGDIVGYYRDATGYHGFQLSRRSAE